MHLDRTNRRVIGSLIEKRLSTPEQYPLTLNSLVLACNQRSNRDPFMDLQEFEVEGCLLGLRMEGFLTIVERDGGRTTRYKERLSDSLGLTPKESSVMAELLLRGAQTEQELAKRCPRMEPIQTVEETLQILDALAARKLVEHLERRPGERIARWRHTLTPPGEAEHVSMAADAPSVHAVPATHAPAVHTAPMHRSEMDTRPIPTEQTTMMNIALPARDATLAQIRDEVVALRDEIRALRAAVDELRGTR